MDDEHLKQYHTLGCSRLGFSGIFNAEQAREQVKINVEAGLLKKAEYNRRIS